MQNPWWNDGEAAFAGLPEFHRGVFDDLYADIQRLPQMVSVTGPRRVGKSTLLKQCIRKLIQENGKEEMAQRIVYFTMDDPALLLPHVDMNRFFEDLVAEFAKRARGGAVYLFLDEIQKFPRWELYLKKTLRPENAGAIRGVWFGIGTDIPQVAREFAGADTRLSGVAV